MGTKRRSMFNPKFKNSRPERWALGRKLQGKLTEAELEEQKLAEATALANESARVAELKDAELAETLRLEEQRLTEEAEIKAKQDAELKAKLETAKPTAPAKKKSIKKTKTTRKPRIKKD